ncbi:MAG: peptidoglycan DD-metalloendopeptidase family protein [Clostridiales bacterium]|nr:peptidoglycan DD-metalloendopeptidase family protein [Candidatus Crickella merdequi]
MDDRKKQALERAYARFLEEQAKAKAEEKAAEEAKAAAKAAAEAKAKAAKAKADAKAKEDAARAAAAEFAKYLMQQRMKGGAASVAGPAKAPAEIEAKPIPTPVPETTTEIKPAQTPEVKEQEAKAEPSGKIKTKAKTIKKAEKTKKPEKEKKEYGYFHPVTLAKDVLLTVEGFGDVLAAFIDGHDRLQAKSDIILGEMGESLAEEYFSILKRYKASRRRIGTACLSMTLMSCLMLLVFDYFTVYEYAYNGRVLGYVDNQENVTDVLEVAGNQLSKKNDVDIEFVTGDNITFHKVSSTDKTVDSSDEAVNKLAYMTDIEVTAYGIYEDDRFITAVVSESGANNALLAAKRIQSTPDDGMKVIYSDFMHPISIKPVSILITSVQAHSDAIEQLTTGGSFDIYHIVDNGENLHSIAKMFSVDEDKVCDADTGKAACEVEIGDKVLIKKTAEPVQIKMIEDGTMSEIIPFKKIRQETNKMYKGDTTISQKGVDGKQIITGKVTKVNGVITKRNLKSKEVINEAVDEITLVGTAERPKTAPTGVFGMPIRNYTLTSRYGYRWGRVHQGLDMAAPTGTPIYAADGGTVTISGWQSGYGYVIYIDHGNGRETRYGHNSKLLVPAGTKVYKGQQIALCGSTGNSTGPHLHFEIRINGQSVDAGKVLGIY